MRWPPRHEPRRLAVTAVVLMGLGACTNVGPDYQKPEIVVPDLWQQALTRGLTEDRAITRFGARCSTSRSSTT